MEEALTALLAEVAGGKRYWVRAPQDTALPYLVMQRISAVRGYTFEGDDGLTRYRVQLDAYGASYTEALTVARAAQAVLTGYRLGDIRGVFVDAERDLPAEDAGEVNHLFRVATEITVWHRQS